MQHGLADTAILWVINGKDSLGFRLVQLGYDVWLGNSRGNRYSFEHQFLDIDNKNETLNYVES